MITMIITAIIIKLIVMTANIHKALTPPSKHFIPTTILWNRYYSYLPLKVKKLRHQKVKLSAQRDIGSGRAGFFKISA